MTNDAFAPSGNRSRYQRQFDFLERKVSTIIASQGSAGAARYYNRQYSLLQKLQKYGYGYWISAFVLMISLSIFLLLLGLSQGSHPLLSRKTAVAIIVPALFVIPFVGFFLI